MELLKEIRQMFIDESISSPMLLSDLANMEKYISESYSGRSLIELLQNADDAGASEFFVKKLNESAIIVANNGKPFDKSDVISLCRSGASTKKRKSSTIGFRGIGFKSVVNYSTEVYLASGNFRILFSREKTKALLNTNLTVPLIRIPHEFTKCDYDDDINFLLKSYNSVFVFITNNNSFDKEVEEFDQSCLLFLNNVKRIIFGNKDLYYSSKRTTLSDGFKKIELESNMDKPTEWLIYNSKKESTTSSIAFKYYENKVIPSNFDESVIHSFMPTKDRLSIPFKINADFSTDPSRTKVVLDDETFNAINNCVNDVISLIREIKSTNDDKYNILNILSYAKQDPLSNIRGKSVNDLLVEKLFDYLKKDCFNNSFIKPNNIEDFDFINICKTLSINPIIDTVQNPNVSKLAQSAGVKELSIENCLKAMKTLKCSELTRIEILNKTIKATRFGTSNEIFNNFLEAKIFPVEDNIVSIKDIDNESQINNSFIEAITSKLESVNDHQNFMRKFGVDIKNKLSEISEIKKIKIDNISTIKRKTKAIKKWRSVEQNVKEVLESLKENYSALDVSEQNLGYDIEVITSTGEKEFYEVKSVEYFGEAISITNNEYTTANQYRDKYVLAITCQSDDYIEICFVRNPIDKLNLTKRIVRWEWICNEYNGKTIKKEFSENGEDT